MADYYAPDLERRRPPPREDRYRPSYSDQGPPPPPNDAREAMYHFRGNAGPDNYRPRRGNDFAARDHRFSFRPKAKLSERPLLRTRRQQSEEQILGSVTQVKFRNVDELTDSDEAEMEDSDADDALRPVKRARIDDVSDAVEKPKWSNPDPYTALPAPSETTGKKLDFIKMIRKARNEVQKPDLEAKADDFISFSATEDTSPVSTSLPPRPSFPTEDGRSRALGKRKREDDPEPKSRKKVHKGRNTVFYTDAIILDEWRADDTIDPTPWFKQSQESSASVRLHREILDFHNWVKPKDYENAVRSDVIHRLSESLNRFESGQMKAFGSFGAGLYLPVGDMDLVYLTRSFQNKMRQGVSNVNLPLPSSQFWRFRDWIRNQDLARPGTIQPIAKAKVPIIKFVERISGPKIDLSFNNDTGLAAVDTFHAWKRQYPEMPIIVSIIKQFLMIRGLNDVAVGGLGGFSIICLVTSLMQHLPVSGGTHDLGDTLLEFFNFYGHLFDKESVAIRLNPPAYVDKRSYARMTFGHDKQGRLHIIDPNLPDNNISGGTSEIDLIMKTFSDSCEILRDRLEEASASANDYSSLLEELIGGDFSSYEIQRRVLRDLYYGPDGPPAPVVAPPPPPPPSARLPPSPPPPPSKSNNNKPLSTNQNGQKSNNVPAKAPKVAPWEKGDLQKAGRRALRLKTLRPELGSKIKGKLQVHEALRIGGYQDADQMTTELTKLEHEYRKSMNL